VAARDHHRATRFYSGSGRSGVNLHAQKEITQIFFIFSLFFIFIHLGKPLFDKSLGFFLEKKKCQTLIIAISSKMKWSKEKEQNIAPPFLTYAKPAKKEKMYHSRQNISNKKEFQFFFFLYFFIFFVIE
jgi:hypothetical protein